MSALARSLAVFVALCGAQGAQALSCMRPDPISTYLAMTAQGLAPVIVQGQLSFDESLLPAPVVQSQERLPEPIPARLSGQRLMPGGGAVDYEADVTLMVTCAGPWCGTAASGAPALYFVTMDDLQSQVVAGPCGGRIFPQPDRAVVVTLSRCLAGGSCP